MKSRSDASKKFLALEGLRGVASVMVLFAHLKNAFFPDLFKMVEDRFGAQATIFLSGFIDGNFGVWLFWVMSAFVLSARFHATQSVEDASKALTSATIRRYPRLALPVLASVMFAWLLLVSGLMNNQRLANDLGQPKGSWLDSFYGFNPSIIGALRCGLWDSFVDYTPESSYNRNLWTMEIEFLGSLFLFAFLALIGKHPSRLVFYAITFVVLNRIQMNVINSFLFGIILSDVYSCRSCRERFAGWLRAGFSSTPLSILRTNWFSLILFCPLIYLIGLPNYANLLHLVLASAVTALCIWDTSIARLLSRPFFVFLGAISFG
ncbi:MAG: acyltransferase family protein, partial [Pirellula sp.]